MTVKILRWASRIVSVTIAFMFALLATDAFHQSGNSIVQFGEFMIHLVPCFLMIGAATAAWYRPGIGGFIILFLALTYLVTAGTGVGLQAHLVITLPLTVNGILFLLTAWGERRSRSARSAPR